MTQHEPEKSPPRAADDVGRQAPAGQESRPDADERRDWQESLREQADERSAGSDEAAANALDAEPAKDAGLHGGLVPPLPR